jgi:hypothetical protein
VRPQRRTTPDELFDPLDVLFRLLETAFDQRQVLVTPDRHIDLAGLVGIVRVWHVIVPRDVSACSFEQFVDPVYPLLEQIRRARTPLVVRNPLDHSRYLSTCSCDQNRNSHRRPRHRARMVYLNVN